MLTIAKLRTGIEAYYLNSVASGVEDYYAGHGEAPGQWRTNPTTTGLGLNGDIDPTVLSDLLTGRLPDGGLVGGRQSPARCPGWDLTWSAPKSVSVLFGLGEADIAAQVVGAHERAVDEGLKYLDRWATVTRHRVDGVVTPVVGEGLIAAGFRHRTSRNLDPQLHTHTLVANATQRPDGSWGAVDSRTIYRHARTAGFVYQTVLRSELTARLGVEWGVVHQGVAEIAGIPTSVRDAFSTRRAEIIDELDDRGLTSARAAQVAAVRTRTTKTEQFGTDVLREGWRERAGELGFTVDDVDRVVDRLTAAEGLEVVSRRQQRLTVEEQMGPAGLTGMRTTFGRQEIVRAWCETIDPRTHDITTATIDTLTATTIADRRCIPIGTGDPLGGVADPRRWSTQDLLDTEHAILAAAEHGLNTATGTASPAAVRHAVEVRATLAVEQRSMVEHLCLSGNRIDAVIGVAGAGKTFALAAAHDAWTATGHPVIGAAVAAKAARQLEDGAGIRSSTLERLLVDLDHGATLPANAVVVVDEAGMVPTRTLHRLLTHTRPDTKIVLVGDDRQLPEIGAGGVLRGITERQTSPILIENRRQADPDERAALGELRSGSVHAAVDWYQHAGRVHTAVDAATARAGLIDAWWDRHQAGRDVLLMAHRRVDVDRLNHAARERLGEHGQLGAERVEAGGRNYAVGDRVLFTHNDRHLDVINGERGTITALNPLRVNRGDDRGSIEVDDGYLDDGHLHHGYAATVHKNQGATCDHALLLASDSMYRELGYVALSRGRESNDIWITDDIETDIDIEAHGHTVEPEHSNELRTALETSARQYLAADHQRGFTR